MVRDALASRSAEALERLLDDREVARDNAVDLVLSRWSDEAVEEFFSRHALRDLAPEERCRVLALLEMERQAMLMQTSCGWFFDDITEPGSVQVMRHAARAMDLARQVIGLDLELAFIDILRRAPSNDPGYATGAAVYEALVRPVATDLARIGAGAALYGLFDLEPSPVASGMYAVDGDWRYQLEDDGRHGLAGTVRVRSRVTGDEALYDVVALFSGMDRVVLGVREPGGDEELRAAWEEVIGGNPIGADFRVYTAPDLSDEERWAVARRVAPGVGQAICAIYRDAAALIGVLADLGIPAPGAVTQLLEHACNIRLAAMLEEGCADPDRFGALVGVMRAKNLRPDLTALGEAASRRITHSAEAAVGRHADPAPFEEIARIVRCAKIFPLPLSLWKSQNICIGMRGHYADMQRRAEEGDSSAQQWARSFRRAAVCLGVRVT